MGEVTVPACDIFGTMQPKGLLTMHVEVTDTQIDDSTTESGKREVLVYDLAVSARGWNRVVRIVRQACQPPKTREAKAEVAATKEAEGTK